MRHSGLKIYRYTLDSTEDSDWHHFLSNKEKSLLVCSKIAEEGLNFQGGNKCIIHFDLPFNPNRIEQRIGRLDRFGSGSPVRSIAIRCTDNPYEMAWSKLLDTGLTVFTESIASLQYLVDEIAREFKGTFLIEGVEILEQITKKLTGDEGLVRKAKREISEQETLDSLSGVEEEEFEKLFEVDDQWEFFQTSILDWFCKVMLIRKRYEFSNAQTVTQTIAYPNWFTNELIEQNEKAIEKVIRGWLKQNPQETIFEPGLGSNVAVGVDPNRVDQLVKQIKNFLFSESQPDDAGPQITADQTEHLLGFLNVRLRQIIATYGHAKNPEQILRFLYSYLTSLIPIDGFFNNLPQRNFFDLNHRNTQGSNLYTFPYTAKRRTVLSKKGQNLRFLRYGEELITGLTKVTENEDRGKSAAIWRCVEDYEPLNDIADLYFRCSFLVETNIEEALAFLSSEENQNNAVSLKATLKRRGDTVFPAFYTILWLNSDLETVNENLVSTGLTWEPRRGLNKNIKSSESWEKVFLKLPNLKETWPDTVSAISTKAVEALKDKINHPEISKKALEKLERIDRRRFAQLETRIANEENPSLEGDRLALKRERIISEHLGVGIKTPKINFDAITAVFLSNQEFE